ncbi:MAG: FtsQ-type POTRA domain-containing protein [Parvularculaceae bacterium]|nr:FtsQ-type POTRA domain-containing protein [Parvularculaceae bacterium]
MPKVTKKPARKAPAKRTTARRPAKKTTRKIARRPAGKMEKLGQRLDQSAGLLAAGAFQLCLMGVVAGGLFIFLLSLFSGTLGTMPERIAAAPEHVARGFGANVMRVTIAGGDDLSTRQIMGALKDDQRGSIIGRPLFLIDPDKIRTRMKELGPVADVAVQKLYPDTLHLSVSSRSPRALYQRADGAYFVMDGEGILMARTEPTDYPEFPVVSGTNNPAEVGEFLTLLRRYPVLYTRTAVIKAVGGRRYDLRFRNGFEAMLPADGTAQALERLQSLDAGIGSVGDNLNYLDLRDPDWAYYQPKAE